jgi:hypothetical protein
MDYRDKNFDEYENYYELEIDNFDELHKELETTIFENIFIEENTVHFFGSLDSTNPFNNLTNITKFREKLQLPLDTKFMVNCITENESTRPHIDNSDNPWAILFPIKNTKNTRLEFYVSSTPPVLKTYTNSLGEQRTVWVVNSDNLTVTDSIELSRPTIINNQRIHNATNPNNTTRWTIALVCAGLGWDPMLAKDYFYKATV